MLSFVPAYYVKLSAWRSVRDCKRLVSSILLRAAVLSTILLYQAAERVVSDDALFSDLRMALWTPFINPNPTAGFLGMVLPLAITHPQLRPLLRWPLLVGILCSLIVLASRSALIAAGVALLSLSFFAVGKLKTYRARIIALGIAGVAAFAAGLVRTGSFENPDYNLLSRLYYWRVAIEVIIAHPMLGVGPGNYATLDSVSVAPPGVIREGPDAAPREHCHNLYLTVAAELGMPACFLLVSVLGLSLRSAIRSQWAREDPVAAGLTAAIAAFLVFALFEYPLTATSGCSPFLLCGLLVARLRALGRRLPNHSIRVTNPVLIVGYAQ